MGGTFQLVVHLFLQLSVILITCRIAGRIFRYFGQTQVVSEMIAGVLLGPSLFGLLFPEIQQQLFPKTPPAPGFPNHSMTLLYGLNQIGLVIYMFLIGLELDTKLLTRHSRSAALISLSGILLPVLMGGAQGWFSAHNSELFTANIAPWQAALFIASAMSITAFPMLARILYESGIAKTKIGTMAIGAAAFDDAAAWCLLACVLASMQSSPKIAILAIGGGFLYALFMFFGGTRLFQWFARKTEQEGKVTPEILAYLLMVLMLCAWFTDLIGIYSIFGAFIAGLCMPRGKFAEGVRASLEPMTVTLLLPIFFLYSGLNTRMNMLVQPSLMGVTLLTITIAFVCKGGGCLLAAKAAGANWRDATAVGVLMNARGLMELILVNIALEKRLISQGLFTILVTMAILTTLVASPLYKWIYRNGERPE
jgi:Kef-type K+ transport system membrane component KefB